MMFLKFFIGVAIALAMLINAIPATASTSTVEAAESSTDINVNITAPGTPLNKSSTPDTASPLIYDPSEDWHDYSIVQVWMGHQPVTMGTKNGFDLYVTVSLLLNLACPSGPTNGHRDCDGVGQWLGYKTKCLGEMPEKMVDCTTTLWVMGRYHSDKIRRNLIIAAAGALQAFTSVKASNNGMLSNCYEPPSSAVGKICIVGDVVRVNCPDSRDGNLNSWNYLHIKLSNEHSQRAAQMWGYDCCRGAGREHVDRLMGNIEDEVSSLFPWMAYREWFNDSRCVMNGWDRCPA